jgi:xanthine dehydrogenase small subunit
MSAGDSIEFLLDGKWQQVRFNGQSAMKPSTTVLNYLRSLDNHKGVKEGCAEGDCGACTIVVAGPGDDGKLVYEALDSCLVFLPMIHGKQLITVENLGQKENGQKILHPVQQTMVTQNGSQCGYCTPGFVMSMFALYKNHHNPSTEVVLDALTGNLCRCTGYNPIVKAAKEACCKEGKDHFSPLEQQVYEDLKTIHDKKQDIELEGGNQKYFLPASLESALQLRKKYPHALIVCGATDAALRQTKKMEHLPLIIDLSGIGEIQKFEETENAYVFGAGMNLERMRQLTRNKLDALHDMLVVFGSLQIRNMATIGGNIGSASPIGDTLPLLFVYNARVELASEAGGRRTLPIEDFITGYRKTALKPDELIVSVTIPKPSADRVIKSYKVSRRIDMDISTVSAAFALKRSHDNNVENIMMAYGGMAAQTQRAPSAEAFLQGKVWSMENIQQAMGMVEQEFTPLSDARSDAESRKIAASNLLLKFYHQTLES